MAGNGLKMGSFHLFRHPKWSTIIFGKTLFDPFLAHFWSQNSPFSRHFGILGGPKRATTGSKHTKNTFFGIPCGPGSFLQKVFCLHPVDLADPFWHPPLWAITCSRLQPTGPRYGGLGVGKGNFEGWKPPKVGGCGWIRCARNRVFSLIAQDMVYFWCRAVRCQCAQILGLLGAFGGRFADILWSQRALEGPSAWGSLAACVDQPLFPFIWPFSAGSRAGLGKKGLVLALNCRF